MEQTKDYHDEESTEEEIENGGKEEKREKIPLICLHCQKDKEFSSENSFHTHNTQIHKQFTVTCPKCLNVFKNKHQLEVHNSEKHPQRRLRHKKPYKGGLNEKKKTTN